MPTAVGRQPNIQISRESHVRALGSCRTWAGLCGEEMESSGGTSMVAGGLG